MSGQSLLGVAAFVAVFAVTGSGVLSALQGRRPVRTVPLDLGLAYLLGLASLGVLLTLEVIVGVPLSLASILISAALLTGAGFAIGSRRARDVTQPIGSTGAAEYIVTGCLIALTLLVLAATFRASRLEGLYGWDAGSFWVPKAEAIFYTGGLDEWHFTTLGGPSYPPLVPVLQAVAFRLFGEVDVVALHLVYWSILAGFAAAAVRLLAPLARPALAWAGVLLVIVADRLVSEASNPQADVLMDLLLGLGVLCVVSWLVSRNPGLFAGALVFLAAAALVKREALLMVACVAGAALVSDVRRVRTTWPLVAALAIVPFLVTVPWRVWFTRRSLPGDGPEAGPLALLHDLDRILPSLRLVLETIADPALWSLIFAVALLSVAAALLAGERRVATFSLAFLVLATAGFVWVMWSFPTLPLTKVGALNPIPRLVGSALVPLGLLVPILLTEVATRAGVETGKSPSRRLKLATAAAVVLVAVAHIRPACSRSRARHASPAATTARRSPTHSRMAPSLPSMTGRSRCDGRGRCVIASLRWGLPGWRSAPTAAAAGRSPTQP